MKAVYAALGVLAFATSVFAAPRAEARKSFPYSTKKGLSYNTASYTVCLIARPGEHLIL